MNYVLTFSGSRLDRQMNYRALICSHGLVLWEPGGGSESLLEGVGEGAVGGNMGAGF